MIVKKTCIIITGITKKPKLLEFSAQLVIAKFIDKYGKIIAIYEKYIFMDFPLLIK